MSGISYAISLILPNEVIYETVMNMLVLPVFFLSTALFPSGNLSGVLKMIVNINPFTHVINIIRNLIMSNDVPSGNINYVIALLIILSICSFALAYHRLRKETSQ
jgi:ABC-2 type transport system permease protein